MKRSKFSEAPIALVLKQAEGGTSIGRGLPEGGDQRGDVLRLAEEVRRANAVGDAPKGGVANRLRQPEEENGKLKRLVADLSLDKAMLQDVVSRKL
jgi:putative transposase